MSHPVITFPRPPPTSNKLTSQQRSQIARSTKKLEQLLGSTPHIVDFSHSLAPLHFAVPSRRDEASRRTFYQKHFKSKSLPLREREVVINHADTSASVRSVSSRSSTSSTRSHTSVHSDESWRDRYPAGRRPPLLQLSLPAESSFRNSVLESIPGSPVDSAPAFRTRPPLLKVLAPAAPPTSRRPSLETIPDSPTAPSPNTTSKRDSLLAPEFTISSETFIRREKMRRVAKILGEAPPAHLVFRSAQSTPEPAAASPSPSPPPAVSAPEPDARASRRLRDSVPAHHVFSPITESDEDAASPVTPSSTTSLHSPASSTAVRGLRHEAAAQPLRKSHFASGAPAHAPGFGFELDDHGVAGTCEGLPWVAARAPEKRPKSHGWVHISDSDVESCDDDGRPW